MSQGTVLLAHFVRVCSQLDSDPVPVLQSSYRKEADEMAISLRLSDQDNKLIRDFARLYGMSVSEFIRNTVIERIEDEIDIQAYREAMAELESDRTTYSMEESKALLGL